MFHAFLAAISASLQRITRGGWSAVERFFNQTLREKENGVVLLVLLKSFCRFT